MKNAEAIPPNRGALPTPNKCESLTPNKGEGVTVAATAWAGSSDQGAGTFGLVGTADKHGVGAPAGLATLTGGAAFGNGPSVPMLPNSWDADVFAETIDKGRMSVTAR